MVAPISVPGNQPINPSTVTSPNTGRRGSQSLSSSAMFSPFSPPGGTSVAAAAALGTSPPTASNMSAGAGFGSGFLAGAGGLGRSISNGKQIGPVVPLMSPTGTGDARGQGILRRLSLGAGAARPNFKAPAVTSPANMPPAADNSVDHSQTDITSSANYFNTLPPAASSAITTSGPAKSTGAAQSFYANPFSGAVLHEHHDEHDHDLVPGMSSVTLGPRDAQSPRRASEAVGGSGGWARDESGLPAGGQDAAARPRKVSFGWSGFMGSGRGGATATGGRPPVAASPPARNNTTTTDSAAPPSILVRHEASPPSGVTTIVQEDKYKSLNGQDAPVSVTVQQVSLASPVAAPREVSTITSSVPRSVASDPPPPPTGTTGKAMLGARGRRGSEAGAGGKKRSVSPMSEHILRGGPGQF